MRMEKRAASIYYAITIVYGTILGFSIYLNFDMLKDLSSVFYLSRYNNFSRPKSLLFAIFSIILLIGLYQIYKKKLIENGMLKKNRLLTALLPVLLLAPFFFINYGFYTLLAFLAMVPILIFRVVSIWPYAIKLKWPQSNFFNLIIISALIAYLVILLTVFQVKLYNNLNLDYFDWGSFLNIIDNTLNGKWFFSDALNTSLLAVHFQPGAVIILAPLIWFFHSEYTIFIINPLVLCSSGIILYLLALRKGISKNAALILSLSFLLCPTISNMSTSVFYGFHMVYLAIPLIALFFFLLDSKHNKSAFLIFLLSLTIKETVPVFWIGIGLVFLATGQKKTGLWLFIVSIIYYFAITKIIMPSVPGYTDFMNRYEHLGGSYTEVIFSPLKNSPHFFAMLFRPSNIYLLILLLLPVFTVAFASPMLLLSGSIIYLFMSLQDVLFETNFSHHLSEIASIIYITAIYGYRKTETDTSNKWIKALLFKLEDSIISRENIKTAALTSLLTASLLSFYYFSISCFFGKNDYQWLHSENCSEEIEKLKTLIPPGKNLSATSIVAAHFVLRNNLTPVSHCYLPNISEHTPGEYVLMELNRDKGTISFNDIETFRYRVLSSDKYNLVYSSLKNDLAFLLLKKEPRKNMPTVLKKITEREWTLTGLPMKTDNNDFSLRYEYKKDLRRLIFHVRAEKKVNYDVFMHVSFYQGTETYNQVFPFGFGFVPAYFADKGDVFSFTVPTGDDNREMKLKMEKRPAPDFTKKPF